MLNIFVHVIVVPILSSKMMKTVFGFIRNSSSKAKAATLASLPDFSVVTNRTAVILGQNPGNYTLQGTNTYLIGNNSVDDALNDGIKMLIDTGEERTSKEYIKILFDEVFPATATKRLSHILLTHHHTDHIGGVAAILEELQLRGMTPLPSVYKRMSGDKPDKDYGFPIISIRNGEVFKTTDDKTNVIAVFTPGHTKDSVSFLIKVRKFLGTTEV